MAFIKLDNAILRRRDLTACDKLVFAYLVDCQRLAGGPASPGQRTIAAECGISSGAVCRSTERLLAVGLLTVERAGSNSSGLSNTYACAARSESGRSQSGRSDSERSLSERERSLSERERSLLEAPILIETTEFTRDKAPPTPPKGGRGSLAAKGKVEETEAETIEQATAAAVDGAAATPLEVLPRRPPRIASQRYAAEASAARRRLAARDAAASA